MTTLIRLYSRTSTPFAPSGEAFEDLAPDIAAAMLADGSDHWWDVTQPFPAGLVSSLEAPAQAALRAYAVPIDTDSGPPRFWVRVSKRRGFLTY